jgi:predicted ester cyclase
MAQDNATIIRRFADEVITEGKIDSGAQYVWEDVVEQVPLPGQGPGLEGLKDILRAMRVGFPDIVFSIKEQITEGDKVASRFEWTGTHEGEFLGIPATGRHVRVWGIVIDRLDKGRINLKTAVDSQRSWQALYLPRLSTAAHFTKWVTTAFASSTCG